MRNKRTVIVLGLFALISLLLFSSAGMARQEKPKIAKPCLQCHQPDEKLLRGLSGGISKKAETLSVVMGPETWLVKFDNKTAVKGTRSITKIPRDKEVAISFVQRNGHLYATTVSVKPPAQIPGNKSVSVAFVADHMKKGDAVIIDSRPRSRYDEGHLVGALSIYDAEFNERIDLLPKNKGQLLIFYCEGTTCRLAPSSAGKAEKLGYTNVKIFHGGMPAWKKAGKLTATCADCLVDQLKAGTPSIIIDLRPAEAARKGHIPGAVSIPLDELTRSFFKFPSDKKAPMVLYAQDTLSAVTGFEIIGHWGGYTNIAVIEDGFEAWIRSGGQVEKGALRTQIVYEPKPEPGEISIEEFKKIVETRPADKYILDVRDEEEAGQGMFIGAKNIPAQDITNRLGELPGDKELIIHCLSGERAELAYHTLKDAGYNARYLNATVSIEPGGKYEISKE